MVTLNDGLYFSGIRLSPDETDAGLEAARAVFDAHGVSPEACATEMLSYADGEPAYDHAYRIWLTAEAAGLKAATVGWIGIPESALLECEVNYE